LKTGQDCSEAGRRIKSLPNYNFFFYTKLFFALFSVYGDYKNSKQNVEQSTENLIAKLQNSNQNSIFYWVSLIGSEQPSSGATLLGWPKSIYYP